MSVELKTEVLYQLPLLKEAGAPATAETPQTIVPRDGVDIPEEDIIVETEEKHVPKLHTNSNVRKSNGFSSGVGTFSSHVDEGLRLKEQRGDELAEQLEARKTKTQEAVKLSEKPLVGPVITTSISEDGRLLEEMDKERED